MIRQSEKYSLDCLRRPRFEVTNAGKFRFSPGMRLGRGVKRSQRQAYGFFRFTCEQVCDAKSGRYFVDRII